MGAEQQAGNAVVAEGREPVAGEQHHGGRSPPELNEQQIEVLMASQCATAFDVSSVVCSDSLMRLFGTTNSYMR